MIYRTVTRLKIEIFFHTVTRNTQIMFPTLAILGFCLMSICMIIDFIALNERERLTALICLFCLVSTYLVFDLIAFDPMLNLDEHVPIEHMNTNETVGYYFKSASI
jgi:hypothetical protein